MTRKQMVIRFIFRSTFRYASLMLVPLLLTGCFKNEHEFLERYKYHMAEAKTAAIANDAQTERAHYSQALAAAREIEWSEGTASVLISMARSLSGSREFLKAESSLRDAQAACANNRCDESTVWSIYDNLFILYMLVMNDLSKADDLIREVEASVDRHNNREDFDHRLMRWKSELENKRKNN